MSVESPHILFVDDEPEIAHYFVKNIEEKLGAKFRLASTVRQALTLLREEYFDLVVLDLVIPDDSTGAETDFAPGLIVLEKIRAGESGGNDPDMPVIIFSAMIDVQLPHDSSTLFLFKAALPTELTERVRWALEMKRQPDRMR